MLIFLDSKRYLKNEKKILLGIFFLGILIRIFYLIKPDICGDPIGHVNAANSIAPLIRHHWISLSFFLLFCALALTLSYHRRDALAVVVLFILVFFIRSGINHRFYVYFQNPPLFRYASAFVIALTGIEGQLSGRLVSTLSLTLLPFFAYYLCNVFWDKKTAFISFLLLMFSPYSILYATTEYLDPLAVFFTYSSLTLVLIGLKKKSGSLLFIGALLYCGVITTKYPALLLTPFLFYIILFKGGSVAKNKQFMGNKIYLVFGFSILLLVLLLNLIFGEKIGVIDKIISSFGVFLVSLSLIERINFKRDLRFFVLIIISGVILLQLTHTIKALFYYRQMSDHKFSSVGFSNIPHFNHVVFKHFGGKTISYSHYFLPKVVLFFYSPIFAVLVILSCGYALFSGDETSRFILLILMSYFVFFNYLSAVNLQYFSFLEFPSVVLIARFLSETSKKTIVIIITGLLLIFVANTLKIMSGNTHAMSDFAKSFKASVGDRNVTVLVDDNAMVYYISKYNKDNKIRVFWHEYSKTLQTLLNERDYDYAIIGAWGGFEEDSRLVGERYNLTEILYSGEYPIFNVYTKM
jgi:4-amino-4-deoxy-L-arabinose transferase-like glycosyltransferase